MDVAVVINASVGLLLKLLNIFLHGIGFYLLRCVHKRSKHNIQLVYITNLSVVELMINLLSFTRNLLKISGLEVFKSRGFKLFLTYSYIFDYAILKFSLYMTMIVLTLDRLFLITLNTIYRRHCNVRTAKLLMKLLWCIGSVIFITAASTFSYKTTTQYTSTTNNTNHSTTTNKSHPLNETTVRTESHNDFFFVANVVTVVLDVLFVLIATLSYTIIFSVYNRRNTKMERTRSRSRPDEFGRSSLNVKKCLYPLVTFCVLPHSSKRLKVKNFTDSMKYVVPDQELRTLDNF